MLLKKTGFPQEEELVLCTVTNVQYHSVFVMLDEYGKTGLIHISEVAPGRIRNIREYVVEGKKAVCKVIKVNKEKGHIDLSLRRVNEAQKRNKLNEIKQQQFAEKIIEQVAKTRGESTLTLLNTISTKLIPKYPTLFAAFEDVVAGNLDLTKILDKKVAQALTEVINTRIKPESVTITCNLTLTTYADDGINRIKTLLKQAENEGTTIKYKGAGTYHLQITTPDYKTAEKTLKKTTDTIKNTAEKNKITWNLARQEA